MEKIQRKHDVNPVSGGRMLLLPVIASLLISAGLIGMFAPPFLESLFSAQTAEELRQLAPLLLLTGVGLEGYFIYRITQRAKKNMAQATNQTAVATTDIPSADPIAQRVEWTPARHGGTNFKAARLSEPRMGRIEVRATWQTYAFSGAFIVIGIGASAIFLTATRGDPFSLERLFPLLFGLLFAGIGAALLYSFSRPGIFDRQLGWYWRGNPALRAPGDIRRLRQATELANIHAHVFRDHL